jgi:ligand-binding sensor domain-containing protein
MKVKLCFFLILFQIGFSQQSQKWKGYFSCNNITDLSESNTKIFAAAENTLFTQDLATQDLSTINTVDGLSGKTIAAVYHSNAFHKTIVGYENGLLIIINDSDNSMLNVMDIVNKNIPANIKRINHFMEYNGVIYISCDFGILQYRLATLEFGDTCLIGPNGQESKVIQTTIFNNEIYAVTQNNGIRKATVTNPNLNDYSQWQEFDGNFWNGITTINNQLIALNTNNKIYKHNGTAFEEIANLTQTGLDIRATTDYLIATSQNHVFVFDQNLIQIAHIQNYQIPIAVTFSCATVIDNTLYIATHENGVVSVPLNNQTNFNYILPSGPIRNNVFAIKATSTDLWAVYGGYSSWYNPWEFYNNFPPLFGISKFTETGWMHIPSTSVFGARSLSKITVNPNNENQVYISSFHGGLLKIENNTPTILYDQTNSGLETLTFDGPNISVRINGTAFDKTGNLWVPNTMIKNSLKVLKKDGQWQSYNTENIIDNYQSNSYNQIVIDKNGTKWMATSFDGIISFNEKTGVFKKITDGADSGNLPYKDVRTLAIDNRNQLWIGTSKGLRVLPSIGNYSTQGQMKTNPIIILEDGLAQELLYEQFITDIVVNGSNQKWVGTADSGVFLFSADGQQTIYHFTTANSPLPSNAINDIDINATTGEVFFATNKGMVSFQGNATKPADNLNNVYVYPNPVRPEFTGTVKIAGLISKATVKITDIEGNLVYETTSEGGTIEWDTTAFGKYKVASGVYMIFISSQDGSETDVKKVMIIR